MGKVLLVCSALSLLLYGNATALDSNMDLKAVIASINPSENPIILTKDGAVISVTVEKRNLTFLLKKESGEDLSNSEIESSVPLFQRKGYNVISWKIVGDSAIVIVAPRNNAVIH